MAGLLLAAALSYLGYLGFQGSTRYYLTVSEALGRGQEVVGQRVRVNGTLLPQSFQREPGSTVARFTLVDPGSSQQLQAIYDGVVPDLFFNEQSQIVAEGWIGPDGLFHSDLLIVKCPSKYAAKAQTT
jgi:cytochrome c-type biogenesis protein CcmE